MKHISNNRKINSVLFAIFALILFFVSPLHTFAADEKDEALSFTMGIIPAENQINKNATYFDLKVKPGQEQDLKVSVSNTGKKDKKIRVTPTNATTNQNGLINYSETPKEYKDDKTLKYPFKSLVGEAQTVEVPAGKSQELTFKLKAPSEEFKGLILGGFVADLPDDDQKDEKGGGGVKIVNKFQVVKAVMLRTNEDKVSPDLRLNTIKPALVGYRTAVTANLQNIEPTMFGKMKVDAQVTKKGSKEVIKKEVKEDLEMAPNSNFDFPIMWNNQRLEPGKYTLNLVATSGDKKWPFTKDFEIKKEESDKLNKQAVDLEEPAGLPLWVYILIGVIVLLLLIIIILLIVKSKKNKKSSSRKGSSKSSSSRKSGKSSSSSSKGKKRKSSSSKSKKHK
ncbi:DUF916 and DUF3324 domain-containing protein [Vagococcus silagei]|uniref:DUF916 and DUF3324 domain-containing protein n=1 Tax=Vagococcus silagei TaxID=2508885 RepID=A0A4V3TUX3_9ENTE|nr:DUF916 and DUF3324 domain-containing protein [Vagococcus silagei]THB60649.1 DUF916 and DUF3324 domain-containing protein [Vagococcus silagei]